MIKSIKDHQIFSAKDLPFLWFTWLLYQLQKYYVRGEIYVLDWGEREKKCHISIFTTRNAIVTFGGWGGGYSHDVSERKHR